MMLYRGKKSMLIWDWPKGKMAWFFWNWHISENDNATYWRIGPITYTVWGT